MANETINTISPESPYKKINKVYKLLFIAVILSALLFLFYSFTISKEVSSSCSFICLSERDIGYLLFLLFWVPFAVIVTSSYVWLIAMAYIKGRFKLSWARTFIFVLIQALIGACIWYYYSMMSY